MAKDRRYHIPKLWFIGMDERIAQASDYEIEQWAADPNCCEMEAAAKVRAERRANGEKLKAERDSERQATTAEEHQRMIQRLQALQYNPFDPRTEVSADAQHIAGRIVTHMWIIFVLLPVVLAILWAVLK